MAGTARPSEGKALLLPLPHADLKVEEAGASPVGLPQNHAPAQLLSRGVASHSLLGPLTQQVAMLLGPSASEPLLRCSRP